MDTTRDAGMTLVEMLVALSIVTVGVLALLGALAVDIKQQGLEKSQATALHLADGVIESAKSMSFTSLVGQAGTSTSSAPVNGVTYTETKTFQVCSPTDPPTTCTTPTSGAVSTVHAQVAVRWTFAGTTHTVQVAQSVSNNSAMTVGGAANPLGSCGGAGTTLVVGSLKLSPSSVTVSATGTPSSSITATLTETGLSNATCVPLTWSDDNGSHQLNMTGSGGIFTVTIPASSIQKSTPTSGGSIAFTATVPGSQAVPAASLTLIGAPAFSSCSVSVVGLGLNVITLTPLTRNSLLSAGLTCTTVNLSSSDSVVASYQSGTGTKKLSMTSTNGSTWTATLPSGSTMVSTGVSEGFTFTLTRASDGSTATQNLTATLA
ncbi:MAG TPA: type II secretion system protein [Mycobacteriales bacterium]|nr:type II secretion system protein [Mycobacteriales bacterium]